MSTNYIHAIALYVAAADAQVLHLKKGAADVLTIDLANLPSDAASAAALGGPGGFSVVPVTGGKLLSGMWKLAVNTQDVTIVDPAAAGVALASEVAPATFISPDAPTQADHGSMVGGFLAGVLATNILKKA